MEYPRTDSGARNDNRTSTFSGDAGMPRVKVISLARSHERRAAFQVRNGHLRYEFFDAVDGLALSEAVKRDSGLFHPELAYTPGAYGCALSHLALWNEAIESGGTLTIAEDDAIFRKDFAGQFERTLATAPADWDIIFWGWNLDFVLCLRCMPGISSALVRFDQAQARRCVDSFQQMAQAPQLIGLEMVWGTPAYTISSAGARRLRDACFPLRPVEITVPVSGKKLKNTGIDSALNAVHANHRAFVSFPPLVLTENDHATSTVQAMRSKSFLSRQWQLLKRRWRSGPLD